MPTQAYTDAQILGLLQEQPEQGIRTLQSRYGGLILRIASRVLTNRPQDVEEIAADVLVLAWKQAHSLLEKEQPLAPWLIVTTRNRAINRWHSLVRKGTLPLDEELQLIAETAKSEGEELISLLVQQMEEPDREIFLRRYYRLETAKEIGAAIGMTPNTVNARLVRGREKLKNQYLTQMRKEQQA